MADEMAERYAGVNAQIGLALARSEIRILLGDIRRSQRVAPEMARYIEARTQLTQNYEDAKAEFMRRVLPLLTDFLNIAGSLQKSALTLVDNAVAFGEAALPAKVKTFLELLREVVVAVNRIQAGQDKEGTDFTNLILNNLPAQSFFGPPGAP